MAGWSSRPLPLRENFRESLSPGPLSIGDQPATLPATIPAIAAAGPKAELERERVRFLERDSGVAGGGEAAADGGASSLTGVAGAESSLEREPLRDLGRRVSGCWSLCLRCFNRPPRTVLRKLSWSRISSSAGFHSKRFSSSDTRSCGGFLRLQKCGMSCWISESGINRMMTATGTEMAPRTKETPHCGPFRRFTEKACPPTKMIIICPATIMAWIPKNQKLRCIPSRMFK